jgi:hypothetical protein
MNPAKSGPSPRGGAPHEVEVPRAASHCRSQRDRLHPVHPGSFIQGVSHNRRILDRSAPHIGRTTVFWSARGRAQRRRRFGCAWRCKSPWHSWRQTHSFPIRISLTLRYFLRRVGMMRQLVAYPVLWGFFGRNQPGEGEFILCAVPGAVRVNSVSQGFANTTRATCPASPYFAFWFTGLSKTMCSGKLAACTPPRLSRRLFCEPPLGWFNGINIPPCSSSIP